jgi:hypothetical protein
MHERRDVPRTLRPARPWPRARNGPEGQGQVRHGSVAPPPRTAANPRAAMRPLRQGRRDRTTRHRGRERPIPPPASIVVHVLSFRGTPTARGGTSESRPARGAAPPLYPPISGARKLTTGFVSESCDFSYPSSLEHPSTMFGSRDAGCASGSRRGAPRQRGRRGARVRQRKGAAALALEGRPFPTLYLSGQHHYSPKEALRSNPSNGPILAAADPRGRVGAPGSVRQPPPDGRLRAPVRSTG